MFADHARTTGAIDPFLRELHVGLGAAIENLVLQAGSEGLAPDVELVPFGSRSNHAARVVLTPATRRPSDLSAQIARRHTNRYPYVVDQGRADRRVRAHDRARRPEGARGRRGLGHPCPRARTSSVSSSWPPPKPSSPTTTRARATTDGSGSPGTRSNGKRDGITVDAAGLSDLTSSLAKILPAQSRQATGESWITSTRDKHTRTAAGYGIVVARNATDVRQQLEGGRLLQRIHLWTTGQDLALHHMNQITERADREIQLGVAPRFGDAFADSCRPAGSRCPRSGSASRPSSRSSVRAVPSRR